MQRHRRMGRPETKAARVSPCCGRPETKAARVSPRCLAMRRDLLTWAHTSPWGRLLSQTGGMEQRRGKSGPLGLHLRVWPFVSQPSHLSTQERRSSERALHDVFPHRQTGENVGFVLHFFQGDKGKKFSNVRRFSVITEPESQAVSSAEPLTTWDQTQAPACPPASDGTRARRRPHTAGKLCVLTTCSPRALPASLSGLFGSESMSHLSHR